jgi:signal transduction histidine kinase
LTPDSPAGDGGDLARLLAEQAALRRVATLVARGVPATELFAAVTMEVGRLLKVESALLVQLESGELARLVGGWMPGAEPLPLGERLPLGGDNLVTAVARTGRPARTDDYLHASGPLGIEGRDRGTRSGVATPVTVDGRLWGTIVASTTADAPLPADTEARLASFTELLAMAIAKAESRADLERLATEQEALRRVATLVARGVPAEQLFAAVTEEAGQLLGADVAALARYEPDGTARELARWSREELAAPILERQWRLDGENVLTRVARTGRSARIDGVSVTGAPIDAVLNDAGISCQVGTPIFVERHLWGVMAAGSLFELTLPAETEERLADFTDLLATAIANADSRAELAASRARIVAAADDARRRIERDLHDGAQQRLVSLGLQLRAAQADLAAAPAELLSRLADGLSEVQNELREIARGIHPAILADGGLGPALRTLARRSQIPVEIEIQPHPRLPAQIEVAAYYVVAEALTNAAKHGSPSVVHVDLAIADEVLHISVRDDGPGGADPARGSGLVGLKDRVEAVAGTLTIESPPGAGTTLVVALPVAA